MGYSTQNYMFIKRWLGCCKGGGRRIKRETRRDRFLTYVRERAYSTGALITMTLTQFDKVTQIRCMQAAAAAAYSWPWSDEMLSVTTPDTGRVSELTYSW